MEEVWEDLQCAGLGIYKQPGKFTYGHDAVLLANFIRAHKGQRMLDLGTGTGIIAILAHAKAGVNAAAVDISKACCTLAEKSVARNKLEAHIRVFQTDLRQLPDGRLPQESFDIVVCNPPYFSSGTVSNDIDWQQSTHQVSCTIEDVASCARRMLKNGGKFYICYPAAQLSQLCTTLEGERLCVKRLALVRSKRGKAPYLVLVEARKGRGAGLLFEDDIVLEDA